MALNINWKQLLRGTKVAGVEASIQSGEECVYHAVLLTRKKDDLSISESHEDLTLDALTEAVKTSVPVNLAVTGKGIILRQVDYLVSDDDYTLLNKVLPNALTEDFYVQAWPINHLELGPAAGTALVAVARKPAVDAVVQTLTDKGYHITDLTLGPYALGAIVPLLNANPVGDWQLGQHILELEQGAIIGYRADAAGNPSQGISLAGEEVTAQLALAFAAGFQWFVPSGPEVSNLTGLEAGKKEYEQKRLFTVGGWGVMLFFLLVLLVNFFLFDQYHTSEQSLSAQVAQNTGTLAAIGDLQQQVDQKRAFMAQMGILDPSRTSFYSDQIAQSVPSTIQLTELAVNPLEKQLIKGRKELDFQPGLIHVSGQTKRSSYLNNWIKTLKKYKWVKSVSVLNYTQDSESVSGEFNIAIQL